MRIDAGTGKVADTTTVYIDGEVEESCLALDTDTLEYVVYSRVSCSTIQYIADSMEVIPSAAGLEVRITSNTV